MIGVPQNVLHRTSLCTCPERLDHTIFTGPSHLTSVHEVTHVHATFIHPTKEAHAHASSGWSNKFSVSVSLIHAHAHTHAIIESIFNIWHYGWQRVQPPNYDAHAHVSFLLTSIHSCWPCGFVSSCTQCAQTRRTIATSIMFFLRCTVTKMFPSQQKTRCLRKCCVRKIKLLREMPLAWAWAWAVECDICMCVHTVE